MKEFLLLIRNTGDHISTLSPGEHKEFLQKCRDYITELQKKGKLIVAQPLIREGKIISRSNGAWKEEPFSLADETQVGYYHILAHDIDEATAIAKGNPEFEYGTTARIEARPVKMKEESTGYVYPEKA